MDVYKNLVVGQVAVPPVPATTGTYLTLNPGAGAYMPPVPFTITVFDGTAYATPINAEIIRVGAIVGDSLGSLERGWEGSTPRAIVAGDYVAQTFTAQFVADVTNSGNQQAGILPDARLSANIPRLDASNTFQQWQLVSGSRPSWSLNDTQAPADARHILFINTNQRLEAQALDDALALQRSLMSLNRSGDVVFGRDISEKNRPTPMGHWIDVPYSAANFGATGGAWTVPSGNVVRFSYMLVGKTAWLQVWIHGGTVSGTPTSLNLVLPWTILAGQSGPCYYYVAPDYGWGLYEQETQDQYIRLKRDAFLTPFAAASGMIIRFSAAVQIL
jgi:hypothetical protein